MQRLDLMLENSPLGSWWLSINNPNQPSLTPLHKELNFILSRYICFGKVSVKLNVVQVCCWRWIFWHSPSWHAAKLPVQPHHSCWAWITSVLLQLCAGTIPEKRVRGSREFLSNAMSCLHGKVRGKAVCQRLDLCRNVAAAMSASSQCHLPSACLRLIFSPGPTQAGWAGAVKGISGCCTSSKKQEPCPRCAAEWWWQGGHSGNWEEAQDPVKAGIWPVLKASRALPCWRKESSGFKSKVCLVHTGKKIILKLKPSTKACNNGI